MFLLDCCSYIHIFGLAYMDAVDTYDKLTDERKTYVCIRACMFVQLCLRDRRSVFCLLLPLPCAIGMTVLTMMFLLCSPAGKRPLPRAACMRG